MTTEIDNIILEHLKRFQASQDRTERKLDEHTQRLGRIEVVVAGLRRDMAHTDEGWADQSVRIDHLSDRIERIERRLDLS